MSLITRASDAVTNIKAVEFTNSLFEYDSPFFQHYRKSDFIPSKSNTILGNIVFELHSYMGIFDVKVLMYKSRWPWSKAIAYASNDGHIRLNKRKYPRLISMVVNTLTHELSHVVDHYLRHNDFGHAGNNPIGKELTAPYLLGHLAQIYYSEGRLLSDEEIRNEF